jgi:ABC-type Mn2+/Zn2+ transport system ATPase subunit
LNQHYAAYTHAVQQFESEQESLGKHQENVRDIEQAQSILQQLAKMIQETAHDRIARVVTKCLESVFPDDPYQFQIQFDRKRGKTEANLQFVRKGLVLENPVWEAGGGTIDVAAFALRVACLVLSMPQKRRLLVIDEPYKMLSAEFRSGIRSMLDTLARELDIQFIVVSHMTELRGRDAQEIG